MDPGFGRVGYGVLDRRGGGLSPVVYGLIQTDQSLTAPERLRQIHESVTRLMKEHSPDCLATERLIFAANRKTAFAVARGLGVVLLAGAEAGLPWTEYTPAEVKMTVTGSGSADKQQVQFMVTRLLGLAAPPKSADASDALAVAICHAHCERVRSL